MALGVCTVTKLALSYKLNIDLCIDILRAANQRVTGTGNVPVLPEMVNS
jgi:hypothetical protein